MMKLFILFLSIQLITSDTHSANLTAYCRAKEVAQRPPSFITAVQTLRSERQSFKPSPLDNHGSTFSVTTMHLAKQSVAVWVFILLSTSLMCVFIFGIFNICRPDVFCKHTVKTEKLRLIMLTILLITSFVLFCYSIVIFQKSNIYILSTHEIQCSLVRIESKFDSFSFKQRRRKLGRLRQNKISNSGLN